MQIEVEYNRWFYQEATIWQKYFFTLYSMVILGFGEDIAPVTLSQVGPLPDS
jgi:hypothetical protein